MNKLCGIYKITNPKNKIYIGQSSDLKRRNLQYSNVFNVKNQPKLYNSIKKYGWKNHIFEIIEECKFDELNNRERYWQEHYDCINPKKGLNCILVKTNEKKSVVSNETKKKQSLNSKGKIDGEKNPCSKLKEWQVLEILERIKNKEKLIEISKIYNISHQVVSSIKLNQRWKHIKRETEQKYKHREIYKFDLEGNLLKKWNSSKEFKDDVGCKSEIISQLISGAIKTYKGFIYQDNSEFKSLIYKYSKRNSKTIICLNDNKVFNSIIEASKFYDISKYMISLNLKKYTKNKKNLNFEYLKLKEKD